MRPLILDKSRDSVVRVSTRVRFPEKQQIYQISSVSRAVLWGPPSLIFGEHRVFFPWGKIDRGVLLTTDLRRGPRLRWEQLYLHNLHNQDASYCAQGQICVATSRSDFPVASYTRPKQPDSYIPFSVGFGNSFEFSSWFTSVPSDILK